MKNGKGKEEKAMEEERRFEIRIADERDAKELLAIYAPYVENTAITFEYDVPSEEEFAGRIKRTLRKYPYLVAERQNMILGYAYAGAFKERAAYDWAVETTVYVRQDCRRMGIGRLLYEHLESYLHRQGILNVNACIASPAEEDIHLTMDSIYFHEKQGYRMAGKFHKCGYKFGCWYDMVWMEKMLGNHGLNQPLVIPFEKLQQRTAKL